MPVTNRLDLPFSAFCLRSMARPSLDDDAIKRMDDALELSNGDRRVAAESIGIPYSTLFNAIYNQPALHRWKGVKPGKRVPDAQAAALRKDPPAVNPAAVVEQAEETLATVGWEGLGVRNKDTIELMQGFESFVGKSLQKSLDTCHGGTLFSYAQAAARMKELSERLEEVKGTAEEYRIHKMWVDANEIMRRCKDSIDMGTKLRLAVEAARKGKKDKKHRKPGFGKGTTAISVTGKDTEVKILQQ